MSRPTRPSRAPGGGSFEGIAAQLDALRGLARKHNATVAVGHCTPAEAVESWEVIQREADEIFVIDPAFADEHDQAASVEHHTSDAFGDEFAQVIDMRFAEWRTRHPDWRPTTRVSWLLRLLRSRDATPAAPSAAPIEGELGLPGR